MARGIIKKKKKTRERERERVMRRSESKGKRRVAERYFEQTSGARLLIRSLETRCFRRVLQWVIARSSVVLKLRRARFGRARFEAPRASK